MAWALFPVRIYYPHGIFFDGECTALNVPSPDGQIGILAHHSNLVLAISPGRMVLTKSDGKKLETRVTNGLLKVEKGEVVILCDSIVQED